MTTAFMFIATNVLVISRYSFMTNNYTSLSSSNGSIVVLDGSILEKCMNHPRGQSYGADNVWEDIILQGAEAMKRGNFQKKLAVFEVGAHAAKQSLIAAKKKFHTFTIEPSPLSFSRITDQMRKEITEDPSLQEYVHLFNVAAGKESGIMLDFKTSGGTGDHVGEVS